MGVPITLRSLAVGTLLAGCAPASREGAAAEPIINADLAITHVAVIDIERGRLASDQDVLVKGTRIIAVVPSGSREPAGSLRSMWESCRVHGCSRWAVGP